MAARWCVIAWREPGQWAGFGTGHAIGLVIMERVEVITGVRRRRDWSLEAKLRILAEASAPGVPATAVARRHDLHPQQIYRWRRLLARALCEREAGAGFAPVRVTPEAAAMPLAPSAPEAVLGLGGGAPTVEILLASGRVLRVRETIAPASLRALARALEAP
jgi:transposase